MCKVQSHARKPDKKIKSKKLQLATCQLGNSPQTKVNIEMYKVNYEHVSYLTKLQNLKPNTVYATTQPTSYGLIRILGINRIRCIIQFFILKPSVSNIGYSFSMSSASSGLEAIEDLGYILST